MTLIIIIVLLALVGSYFLRQSQPQIAAAIQIGAIVVGLIVVLFVVAGRFRAHSPKIDDRFVEAAGYKLGQAVAQACPSGGDVLVVVGSARKINNAQLAGLRNGFGDARLSAVVVDFQEKKNEAREDDRADMDLGEWGDHLVKWIADHGEVVAVVSFQGVPSRFDPGAWKTMPPLFAFQATRSDLWRHLLELDQALRLVVTLKDPVDWEANPPRNASLEEIFAVRYRAVTPAD